MTATPACASSSAGSDRRRSGEGQDQINEKMERIARGWGRVLTPERNGWRRKSRAGGQTSRQGDDRREQIDPEGIGEEVEEVAQAMKQRLIERIVEGKKGRLTRRQEEWLAREQEKDETETTAESAGKSRRAAIKTGRLHGLDQAVFDGEAVADAIVGQKAAFQVSHDLMHLDQDSPGFLRMEKKLVRRAIDLGPLLRPIGLDFLMAANDAPFEGPRPGHIRSHHGERGGEVSGVESGVGLADEVDFL